MSIFVDDICYCTMRSVARRSMFAGEQYVDHRFTVICCMATKTPAAAKTQRFATTAASKNTVMESVMQHGELLTKGVDVDGLEGAGDFAGGNREQRTTRG
jgi:hypothetical protein